jgi:hypothetical protein
MSKVEKIRNLAYFSTFTPACFFDRHAIGVSDAAGVLQMVALSYGKTVICAYRESLDVRLYHLDDAPATLPYIRSIAREVAAGSTVNWFRIALKGESLERNYAACPKSVRKPRGIEASFCGPSTCFNPAATMTAQLQETADSILGALGITDTPQPVDPVPKAPAPTPADWKNVPPHRRPGLTLRAINAYLDSLM